MNEEYSYWEIWFTSCEGNKRWTVARAPYDWSDWEVRDRVRLGGCGDDPAEVLDVFETTNEDYGWDFSE